MIGRRALLRFFAVLSFPVLATAQAFAAAPSSDGPEAHSPFPVTCRQDGRALTRLGAADLSLLVGICDEHPAVSEPSPGLISAPAEPADCPVPGLDDRCEAWTAPRYDGPWSGADYPGYGSVGRNTTVLAHPTEDLVFVAGTSTHGTGTAFDADFSNIAYTTSTGAPVWSETYEGFEELTLAYQSSLALSPDGDTLYALGEAAEPGVYDYSSVIVALDPRTGRILWDHEYDWGIRSIQTALTVLPNGSTVERIYAAGTSAGTLVNGSSGPVATVAGLEPDGGDVSWTSRFPGQTPDGSRFNEVVVSPDGATVYGAGGEHRPDRLAMNFLTVAFRAADGATQWAARDSITQPLGSYGINGVSDMKITPDGSRVLIAGFDPVSSGSFVVPSTSPILTVARDASTGAEVWRKAYGGPVAGETHFYFSLFQGMMGLSPNGRTVVLTAAINSASGTATVAYDVETGSQRWGVESNEAQHGYAFVNYIGYYPTVMVGADRAFVSNRRGFGLSQYRTVTMAHALEGGGLAWTGRLGINRTLFGGSALSPDGKRLIVTAADHLLSSGLADPGLDSVDILTVSYET